MSPGPTEAAPGDRATVRLYRLVGQAELDLIAESGYCDSFRGFRTNPSSTPC